MVECWNELEYKIPYRIKTFLARAECGIQVVMEQHNTSSAGQISQVVKSLQGVWNTALVLP